MYIKERPLVSTSGLYLNKYICGYETPALSIHIFGLRANFMLLSLHITNTQIPPSAHCTHHLPNTNTLHTFFCHSNTIKNYHNSQPSSGKHIFTAPCGVNPRNPCLNGSTTSGMKGSTFQGLLPSSHSNSWSHFKLPLA